MTLPEAMSEFGVKQVDLARHLGVAASTMSLKLSGDRPWELEEAKAVLAYMREHCDPSLTLDGLFGEAAA